MHLARKSGLRRWVVALAVAGALGAPMSIARADGNEPIPVGSSSSTMGLQSLGVTMYGVGMAMSAVW